MSQSIYSEAKACLHLHVTLDESVPSDVGCAEAVSYVLKAAGVTGLPQVGIAGTSDLWAWLRQNFSQVTNPLPGDIVISPTGTSSLGSSHGHTGIVGQFGILSNDSDTGLFLEKYTVQTWQQFFGHALGFPVFYFRAK